MLNLVLYLFGIVVLFFAAVYLNELVAGYRADKRYPMLGRAECGHHILHISCMSNRPWW
jgi:hypothetical protein